MTTDAAQVRSRHRRIRDWYADTIDGAPDVYVVAEPANAHEGDPGHLVRLVEAAAEAGADAVKVQCFSREELLVRGHPMEAVFDRIALPPHAWEAAARRAHELGIEVLADVFGLESLEALRALDEPFDGYKVHASDIGNIRLLEAMATDDLPILLSTGGSLPEETEKALRALDVAEAPGGRPIVFMVGVQTFPTPLDQTRLHRIQECSAARPFPVGCADHVPGDDPEALWVPLIAVGAGARLIEKHITLDRSLGGTDHHSALEPHEFARLVRALDSAGRAIGRDPGGLGPAELEYRRAMKKTAVTARPLPEGHLITLEDLVLKRGAPGEEPLGPDAFVGTTLSHEVDADHVLRPEDVGQKGPTTAMSSATAGPADRGA